MASPGLAIKLFKGWDQFASATDPKRFRRALARKMQKATELNCIEVRKAIAKEIRQKHFDKNSRLTVLFKMAQKPLVGGNMGIGSEVKTGGGTDSGGTMLNSLGHTVTSPFEGYVGVVRTRGGFNIALIVHEGATLNMTEKRKKWLNIAINSALKKQGMLYLKSKGKKATYSTGGAAMHIPKRPFIVQVMQVKALQMKIIDRWATAASEALRVT